MTKKIRILLILTLFNATTIAIYCQKPNYKFKPIQLSDGLINGSVLSLYEDSYGFIWIGTQQGIQRYDGKSFKNYQTSLMDSTGLSSNFVYNFCEDNDKNIWISNNAGLDKYNRKTDKIVHYKLSNEILKKNGMPVFTSMLLDPDNPDILWLTGNGILKLNYKSGETKFYDYEKRIKVSTYATYFRWIKQNPLEKDELLVGATDLIAFNKKNGKYKVLFSIEQNSEIPNNLITDLAIDPANNEIVWLTTGDIWGKGSLGSLIQYNLINSRKKIFTAKNRPNDLTQTHLLRLCFYDINKLWIASRNGGIFLYDKSEDKFYNYQKSKYNRESLSTSFAIISMLKDKSGTMWFGSWGEGISLLTPTSQKFSHFNSLYRNDPKFITNSVTAFAEDKDGNIWIGTEAAGLSKFNPKTKAFEHYFQDFVKDKRNSIQITSLLSDNKNNLWIGTYNDGLYRYNDKTKNKIHFISDLAERNLAKNRITTVSELKKGEIIITTYGAGLYVYNYSTDSFKHYVNDPKDSTSLPDNQMWMPAMDNTGNYYFTGNSTGDLIKFNPTDEKFSYDNNKFNFTMTCKNSNGNYYVNSLNLGLCELQMDDSLNIKIFLDQNGNTIGNIESILVDSDNKVWMGRGDGIIEFDPSLKSIKRYDVEDGLNGYQFNRLSALKASTGEMYFGGTDGFTYFHPSEIKLSNYKPPIVFTDFKLFQKTVDIGKNSVLKNNILLEDTLNLDYDQNDFSISFSALDFSEPHKINYKYILENRDKNWVNAGHNNSASYTNIDPGEYVFKVLATNSDGVWIKEPKKLSIIINPPIWQTTSAYVLYGLLFIAGIFGVDRIQRKRLLTKERVAAQIKEAEFRAQIAEKDNERKTHELEEARNLQLSMLPKSLPSLPHLDIAVYMKTATEVGGDYYDYHIHMDGTLTAVLGDATGHGMQSGMMVSIMKSLFMSDRLNTEIQPFFQNTNIALKDMNLGRLMMALSCVQINNNTFRCVMAGMPPILFYKRNLNTVEEIVVNNMPLGAMKTSEYDIIERELDKGDTIILMSDGFAELQNEKGEMIGYQETRNIFENVARNSTEEIIEMFKKYQIDWTNGKDPDDDVTFMVIKVK